VADDNRKIFLEKVKLGKFFTESKIFFNREKSEREEEMHRCLRGDGRPCV